MICTFYVLFQECSKKQKNDDTQSTSVDALSSNDGSEEVMFLLKPLLGSIFFCIVHPKGGYKETLSATKCNEQPAVENNYEFL